MFHNLSAAIVCLMLAIGALPVAAATFNVTTTADDVDDDIGDGVCENSLSTDCSLRAAIQEANGLAGADTIVLPAGTYLLSLDGDFENSGATGDLDIFSALTIDGAGPGVTIIDADGLDDRVFDLLSPPAVFRGNIPVEISGVTITGGVAPVKKSGFGGGGIRNGLELTISDCVISDNHADNVIDGGGGILNHSVLDMTDCVVQSNTANRAEQGGGGLLNRGNAMLENCEISNNAAEEIFNGGGGGIANRETLTIEHCDLLSNSADDSVRGGGGLLHSGEASLEIFDSTIDGNHAVVGSFQCTTTAGGGGLSILSSSVLVDSTTISNNTVAEGCEGSPVGGGGVSISDVGDVSFVNSTISGNLATSPIFGGGGLFCDGCSIGLFNCTVTDNEVTDGSVQDGGGIALLEIGSVFYANTIVVGNRVDGASGGVNGDCAIYEPPGFLDIDSGGYNLLGDDTGCPDDSETDVLVSDFSGVLGRLQDNGGPTETHALLPGSPAIDGGEPLGCEFDEGTLTSDQRGAPRPVDGDEDEAAICDIGSYEFAPAFPPVCTRVVIFGEPTTELIGKATDDSPGDTGIFEIELVDAVNVTLDADFSPGDPEVFFTVICGGEVGDFENTGGVCSGSSSVLVTDGEGETCSLQADFDAVPAGPLVDFPICEDDGLLLQITNPVPDSNDPENREGTASCTYNPFDEGEPPLGPGREPVEECRVITLDSPVSGVTDVTLKVEASNLLLRLMASAFDEQTNEFLPWEDHTDSVDLIVEVIPDPTRLRSRLQWSPVKITCALLVDVDCGDPANVDADLDGDGFSPCPSPNNPEQRIDCDDRKDTVNPDAEETCNGLDDNCDGQVDEGLDSDGDTVADCFDNCPDDPNPPEICDPLLPEFQCDEDGDGVGDVCDDPDDEGDDDEGDDEGGDEGDDERADSHANEVERQAERGGSMHLGEGTKPAQTNVDPLPMADTVEEEDSRRGRAARPRSMRGR